MKAMIFTKYGSPSEVLKLKEVEKPIPKDNEVLIKISAASVNTIDWSYVRGKPFMIRLMGLGLLKPKNTIPGADLAGRVEAVGKNVTQIQPGDEVYGDIGDHGLGAYAEYVSAPEAILALKPSNMTFDKAAAVPQAAVVALQALRDTGRIQPGQTVLINGASGGIGTFAVQLAKAFGAVVTGVCSTQKMDMVRTIGADYVVDYMHEDFTQSAQRYDLILDIVANRALSNYTRALRPDGHYVAIAFNPSTLVLGPLISLTGEKKVSQLSHKPNDKDLIFLKELIETGKVEPVIDRRYPLHEVARALQYYGEGHPSGKVVITVEHAIK